jgi:hypothetical protein
MADLTEFQNAFCAALDGNATALSPWLAAPPADAMGLSVYRNTVARGMTDALVATYSTVMRMVGEEWFRAACAVYVRENRPREPSLLHYGADFPVWLSTFRPAFDTPYLSTIAELDRMWWESYFAADAELLDPTAFSELDASKLELRSIRLHPSVRLIALDQNLGSLWLAHQSADPAGNTFQIDDRPEHVLFVRTGMDVMANLLDLARYEFLTACAAGESLLTAAERAAEADAQVSFSDIISSSLAAGVLSRLERHAPRKTQ